MESAGARKIQLPIEQSRQFSVQPLFRAALGRTGQLSPRSLSRIDVGYMVRRRAADSGLETAIGCHIFRATGIADYLTNGGKLEIAQRMAGQLLFRHHRRLVDDSAIHQHFKHSVFNSENKAKVAVR